MGTDKQFDLETWNSELVETLGIVYNRGIIVTSFINEETKVRRG